MDNISRSSMWSISVLQNTSTAAESRGQEMSDTLKDPHETRQKLKDFIAIKAP